jgi:hypothetical protein
MVAIAENSTLSALLPVIATTAVVPLALIVVGAGITLSSVVFGLYQHHQGKSAQTISALNLDFSPFLWEIEGLSSFANCSVESSRDCDI